MSYTADYVQINWENVEEGITPTDEPPIDATNLGKMDFKIKSLDTWAGITDPLITNMLKLAFGTISGLDVTNAADTDHDITIGAGYCTDSTGAYMLVLPSAMTKQIDASWAAGNNAGGLFSGSVANSTCYYKILIRKDSDGSIDWGWDTSITAANKPSGYTYYRVIGSNFTDGSANIRNGKYKRFGNLFHCQYNSFVLDRAQAALANSSRVLVATSVPPDSYGIYAFLINGSSAASYVSWGSPYETDLAPSSFDTAKARVDSGDGLLGIQAEYLANASSQIYFRADTGSGVSVGVKTEGYIQIL